MNGNEMKLVIGAFEFIAGRLVSKADPRSMPGQPLHSFRGWADQIGDEMGPKIGMPYNGKDYLSILPVHWLCEPDHLELSASLLWEEHGVAPGSGTDATTEMVSPSRTLR
eukprot:TRINITY_DN2815_c0_g1_i3.p2 TRINITY_DN2815_c0_g1~~TRINITY_DN2815_c0_g1_i3.p2  ORF type:complete len:110 (-),score=4.14 TRINITY_DN2815_c0_g1_i3:5-334(-)